MCFYMIFSKILVEKNKINLGLCYEKPVPLCSNVTHGITHRCNVYVSFSVHCLCRLYNYIMPHEAALVSLRVLNHHVTCLFYNILLLYTCTCMYVITFPSKYHDIYCTIISQNLRTLVRTLLY